MLLGRARSTARSSPGNYHGPVDSLIGQFFLAISQKLALQPCSEIFRLFQSKRSSRDLMVARNTEAGRCGPKLRNMARFMQSCVLITAFASAGAFNPIGFFGSVPGVAFRAASSALSPNLGNVCAPRIERVDLARGGLSVTMAAKAAAVRHLLVLSFHILLLLVPAAPLVALQRPRDVQCELEARLCCAGHVILATPAQPRASFVRVCSYVVDSRLLPLGYGVGGLLGLAANFLKQEAGEQNRYFVKGLVAGGWDVCS